MTVQDSGIGVAADQQHLLFRPFVMVGTTTRNCGGTSLGLAISRNLIELMGGSITLYSAGSGQGTTVAIAMPAINVSLLRTPLVLVQPSPSRVFVSEALPKRVGESQIPDGTSYMAGVTDENQNGKR